MKTLITLPILYICLMNNLMSQELMKIGEVFDFEINDEFHFTGNAPDQTPNADRITIIDKYYSTNGDTVFYIEAHNSYQTNLVWEPEPYLEYYFWTDTITVQYYDLDSSIYYYDEGFQSDSNIYYSTEYCDSLVNECEYEVGQFEPDYYRNIYGRGLGLAYRYLFQGGGPFTAYDIGLFYYKKNGIECGTPDTTTVEIKDSYKKLNNFEVYPNPTASTIFLRSNFSTEGFELFLFNSSGHQIQNKRLIGEINSLDISGFTKGFYYLQIIANDKIENFKIMKK